MKTRVEELIETIREASMHLSSEATKAARNLPEPGVEVGALLNALAEAEEHAEHHFNTKWGELEDHTHAECEKQNGGLCARCQDWRDCCAEKDRAVAKLIGYALALRAKREAA